MKFHVTSFTKEVNLRLAKRSLKANGRLANRGFTSFVKEATGRYGSSACIFLDSVNLTTHSWQHLNCRIRPHQISEYQQPPQSLWYWGMHTQTRSIHAKTYTRKHEEHAHRCQWNTHPSSLTIVVWWNPYYTTATLVYIPLYMHTVLLCFLLVINLQPFLWFFYPYSSV